MFRDIQLWLVYGRMRKILKGIAARSSATSKEPYRTEYKKSKSALSQREASIRIFKTYLMLK